MGCYLFTIDIICSISIINVYAELIIKRQFENDKDSDKSVYNSIIIICLGFVSI